MTKVYEKGMNYSTGIIEKGFILDHDETVTEFETFDALLTHAKKNIIRSFEFFPYNPIFFEGDE